MLDPPPLSLLAATSCTAAGIWFCCMLPVQFFMNGISLCNEGRLGAQGKAVEFGCKFGHASASTQHSRCLPTPSSSSFAIIEFPRGTGFRVSPVHAVQTPVGKVVKLETIIPLKTIQTDSREDSTQFYHPKPIHWFGSAKIIEEGMCYIPPHLSRSLLFSERHSSDKTLFQSTDFASSSKRCLELLRPIAPETCSTSPHQLLKVLS
jgi:hypothetical protein